MKWWYVNYYEKHTGPYCCRCWVEGREWKSASNTAMTLFRETGRKKRTVINIGDSDYTINVLANCRYNKLICKAIWTYISWNTLLYSISFFAVLVLVYTHIYTPYEKKKKKKRDNNHYVHNYRSCIIQQKATVKFIGSKQPSIWY